MKDRFEKAPSPAEQAIIDLTYLGLKKVASKYGPDGDTPLSYHNLQHTLKVMSAVNKLGTLSITKDNPPISEWDRHLLMLAAAWHDVCQEHKEENEQRSADLVWEAMSEKGVLTHSDMEQVYSLVMATRLKFQDGEIVQSTLPANYATMLMADADLSNLGRPFEVYFDATKNLFKEFFPDLPADYPLVAQFGLDFIQQHQFLTPEAKQAFPHQEENIVRLESFLRLSNS